MSRPDLLGTIREAVDFGALSTQDSDLGGLLRGAFDLFTGVPDSELTSSVNSLIYNFRDRSFFCVAREDVAVAVGAGHYLAGGRPLLFFGMQGLAAAIEALTSLCVSAGIPLVLLTSWSANADHGLSHKRPIGNAMPDLLSAVGISVQLVDDEKPNRLARELIRAQAYAVERSAPAAVVVRGSGLRGRA